MAYLDDNGNPVSGAPDIQGPQITGHGTPPWYAQPGAFVPNPATAPYTFDPSRIIAKPGESTQQTLQRYQDDYHAADRDEVLYDAQMWAANGGLHAFPQAGGQKPADTQGSAFDGSLASVQAALTAGGWGPSEDANYWASRIQQTGGATPGNLAYWQARIAAGPAGGQPGGAYYDPGAGTNGVDQPFSYPAANVPAYAYTPFVAPTAEQAANEPGFQATVDTANKGLLRQRAALGSVLTGGTLQDLSTLDAGLGAQNYQNVYTNAANANAMNNAGYLQQHNTSLSDYEQGLQNALAISGYNQGVNQQSFNNALNLANTTFGQNLSLAQLGMSAAGGANTAGNAYASNAGNLYTGIGNANAAGQVGFANAWNNLFGNAANLANFWGQYNSLYGNRQTPLWQGPTQ